MRPDRASMCRLPGGCNVIPAAAFGLLGVAYPVGGTLAVYLGAVALDATGSCAPLIPVILGSLVLWSVALWIAGPRRARTIAVQPAA